MHVADLETLHKAPSGIDMLTLPPRAKLEVQAQRAPAAANGRSDALTAASAREIAQRIASKDISVVEVAQAVLAKAEEQKHLNAFITLRPEQVLKDAKALDARLAKGETLGVLAGVPVSRLIPDDPKVENLIVLAATELTTDSDIEMLAECLTEVLK